MFNSITRQGNEESKRSNWKKSKLKATLKCFQAIFIVTQPYFIKLK